MCQQARERTAEAPAVEAPALAPAAEKGLSRRVCVEMGTIINLAWPQSVTGITSFLPRLLILVAVGHLENGAVLIGAAGIGSMYANFAHLMLMRSSLFGASGLLSQAFGAANHQRVGLILMRVLVLHTIIACLLSVPLTAVTRPLMVAFGQPDIIADHAQTFVYFRLIGLPGLIVWTDLTAFLQAQRCVRTPMCITICSAVIQIFLVLNFSEPSSP